jgi:hypothetical protein
MSASGVKAMSGVYRGGVESGSERIGKASDLDQHERIRKTASWVIAS